MRNFENKEKIVQVSGGLRIVSFVFMLFLGCGIFEWLLMLMLPTRHGETPVPNWDYIGFILVFMMEFMVWWNFWSFFSRLKAGHLFDALTVKRLTNAGRWKIAAWFYSIIFMWVENTLQRQLQTHVLSDLLDGLFVGVGIVFVAWLLREAQTMEEEQKLTV